ncbi:MAG: hypothetical protein RPR97_08545 [Colwellia sp.]
MEKDIIDSILSCEDLYVILENRWGDRYVESYELPNILYSDGKFWGKFRSVHSAFGLPNIEENKIVSYAYNNFANVVCTSEITDRYERYYSRYAYGSLKFITRNKYNKIWESTNNNKNFYDLLNSVRNGLKLKLLIKSTDNYTYIIPIHTAEVYEKEKRFSIYTECDGYPEKLRHFEEILEISDILDSMIVPNRKEHYPIKSFLKKCSFFLTFFNFEENSLKKQSVSESGNISHIKFNYEKVEIWSET